MIAQPPETPRYEARDISVKAVLACGAGLLLMGVIVHFALGAFMLWLARPSPSTSSRTGAPLFEAPPPRLQLNPKADLQAWRATEDQVLNHYAWMDRTTGIVRLPIERAMELTLARGLPAREPQPKP